MYCPECGSPSEYTSKKPNFCMSCGYNFITKSTQASSSKAPNPPEESPPPSLAENSEELDEYDLREIHPSVHQMQGLDVEITKTEASSMTFGQMFPELDEKKAGNKKKK